MTGDLERLPVPASPAGPGRGDRVLSGRTHRRHVAFARFSGELRALRSIALCNCVPDVTFSIVIGRRTASSRSA